MDELSILQKSRVAEFIAKEKDRWPDWFLSETARNFSAPSDVTIYFTAFCVALAHIDKALLGIDKILHRVKSIFKSMKAIIGQTEEGKGKSKGLRLKLEEKVVVVVYRSMCKGEGGMSTKEIAQFLRVSESEVDETLSNLQEKRLVCQGAKSKRWSLVLA